MAVEFMPPQPHINSQSGRCWRICSQVADCSIPGADTGYLTKVYPYFCDSFSSVEIGSLPEGVRVETRPSFLPLSLSSPPIWSATYLTIASACAQCVAGNVKT